MLDKMLAIVGDKMQRWAQREWRLKLICASGNLFTLNGIRVEPGVSERLWCDEKLAAEYLSGMRNQTDIQHNVPPPTDVGDLSNPLEVFGPS
jgi:hypothetical protein